MKDRTGLSTQIQSSNRPLFCVGVILMLLIDSVKFVGEKEENILVGVFFRNRILRVCLIAIVARRVPSVKWREFLLNLLPQRCLIIKTVLLLNWPIQGGPTIDAVGFFCGCAVCGGEEAEAKRSGMGHLGPRAVNTSQF